MSGAARVLVIDDHPVVREGVAAALATEPDVEIVGQAGDWHEAVELAVRARPDVILLDLQMPGKGGLEILREIRQAGVDARVLVFTAFDLQDQLFAALREGADGYLLKGAPKKEMINAIRVLHAGGTLVEPAMASRLLREIRGGTARRLTRKEEAVLRLVADGKPNKAIAKELFISERTVKFHVSSLLSKLEAANRTEAVAAARKKGYLLP